ncbi:MAG: glycosyltransferase [Methylococcales bacterium]|nr:glycosyltransferase [Methylococcales bacterium]
MNRLDHSPTVVVFSLEYKINACAAIRILTPMLANNWKVIWATMKENSEISFNVDVASQADVIIIHRQFPCELTEKMLQFILALEAPMVYDLDDMFFDIHPFHPSYHSLKKHFPYIKWILKEADIITVSTLQLKKSLSKYTSRPIHINPNIIDFNLFFSTPRLRTNQFNFLVSGTATHQRDWAIIEEPIVEILKIYGEKINFVFFGDIPKRLSNHSSVNIIPFQPNYKQYARELKELDIHAALVPLEDTKFNQGKSNIKWLEYSAAGIPGAYSDITPYNSCIRHEENGLLVKNNPDSWFDAMNQLIVDSEKTDYLIKNAQSEVRERYSIESSLAEYTSVVDSLLGQEHQHNIFSELPIYQHCLEKNIKNFLDRHINWRFK